MPIGVGRRLKEGLRAPYEITWSIHGDAAMAGKQLEDGKRERMREDLGNRRRVGVGGHGLVPLMRGRRQVHLKVARTNGRQDALGGDLGPTGVDETPQLRIGSLYAL
jgi:hypothetical protein